MKKVFSQVSKCVSGFLVVGVLTSYSLSAATIDTSSIKVGFTGYKTEDMVETSGMFKKIKFTFGKDKKSITGVLKGASAVIVPTSSVIPELDDATKNMNTVFFPALAGKESINVVIQEVVEGDGKGLISAKISIGNQSTIVPLVYEIKNKKLMAQGKLDLNAFSNATQALSALSKAAPGHADFSWAVVDLTMSANVK